MGRRTRAASLVEVLLTLSVLAVVAYLCHSLVVVSSRRSAALDKKTGTCLAASMICGRLRRDLKWAESLSLADGGRRVVLTGPGGAGRSYVFDKRSGSLRLPSDDAGARRLLAGVVVKEFRLEERSGALVAYLVSILPAGADPSGPDGRNNRYATTVLGEVRLARKSDLLEHPYRDRE